MADWVSGPNGFEFEVFGGGFIIILRKFTLLNAFLKFLLQKNVNRGFYFQ